jgi:hypothetical protein
MLHHMSSAAPDESWVSSLPNLGQDGEKMPGFQETMRLPPFKPSSREEEDPRRRRAIEQNSPPLFLASPNKNLDGSGDAKMLLLCGGLGVAGSGSWFMGYCEPIWDGN